MNTPRPKRKSLSEYTAKQAENRRLERSRATRETVESVVVAVILAFLFRSFVAEAFVIPTGSMAPTLQGRHMDVECPQCGHRYRAGASSENRDRPPRFRRMIEEATCPMCRHVLVLERPSNLSHNSFNGDRILVSKFAYALSKPQRWDVIVFKYPGNAKQNYIKRLVGLPGEIIRIRGGDIWFRPLDASAPFKIARKPDHKMLSMLQIVADTKYIARAAKQLNWPAPYLAWSRESSYDEKAWETLDGGSRYKTDGSAPHEAFVRFHQKPLPWREIPHLINGDIGTLSFKTEEELRAIRSDVELLAKDVKARPITDYYAYNDFTPNDLDHVKRQGLHWVGDLAVETHVTVESGSGELIMDLVEGGIHYQCRIDVSNGQAKLVMKGGSGRFGEEGDFQENPVATTSINKPGQYVVRLSNVDNEIRLWVNKRRIKFDAATTYEMNEPSAPAWSETDPLDLAPAGVGSLGAALAVNRIRLFRDGYYIAGKYEHTGGSGEDPGDYGGSDQEYDEYPYNLLEHLGSYESWSDPTSESAKLFASRQAVEFHVPDDAYFPLGDNSPASKDARYWTKPDIYSANRGKRPGVLEPYVKEELMIGKAMMIYWPHAWPTKLKLFNFRFGWPNFERMGFIR